jgi:hypothetical protein
MEPSIAESVPNTNTFSAGGRASFFLQELVFVSSIFPGVCVRGRGRFFRPSISQNNLKEKLGLVRISPCDAEAGVQKQQRKHGSSNPALSACCS